MLKLVNIKKDYVSAGNVVPALKGVSLCFRKNEFVSILGASGCGKTTLLNIIGGLDHYTSGDLVIGGISKTSVTRGVNGIPLLKDLPVLGWLFSTETDTVKKSQYVLIASVEYATPADQVSKTVKGEAVKLAKETEEMAKCPAKTAGFQQLLIDTNEIK